MLRQAVFTLFVTLAVTAPSLADSIGPGASPYGFTYSPSSSPFESFEWTPLDLAAFAAYGGDFANVRRPITPIYFYEPPAPPPGFSGPDDELAVMSFFGGPTFDQLPTMSALRIEPMAVAAEPIPEPGALLLVGLGMLGVSTRLRRAYRNRVAGEQGRR